MNDATAEQIRLAVYCDYPYRIENGTLSAEQPVGLFLGELSRFCRLTMVGRYDRSVGSFPYVIDDAEFVGLPHYASGASALALLRSMPVSLRRFWRLLDRVDAVWLLGPVPISVLFAFLTLLRGKRLTLGVRQDLPRLADHRHPDRPLLRFGARVLEASYRVLSLRAPVAVVGPQIAHNYRYARRLHTMYISLLRDRDLADDVTDDPRDYAGSELRMLSVGRIDPEKNPLLLADILARAIQQDPRWTLDVCGEGPLSGALAQRFEELGVSDRATMHGHVPIDGGLLELYERSHAFMHVSFSEGVPQVLLEAFATRLPVVATAVGGVPALVGGAGLLVEAGDADAAVEQLVRISADAPLRRELTARGLTSVREHTLEAETARLAAFLLQSDSGCSSPRLPPDETSALSGQGAASPPHAEPRRHSPRR